MPQETPLPLTDGPSQLPPTATVNEAPDDPARTVDRAEAGTHLAASELPPESLGRFVLAGEIGRGGMGCVLRGHDPDLDRDLAIKILLPAHRGHAELERRFLEEARIAGRLEHPGVPPVHELGRADDGRPFFAMKLIRGQTLAELLRERNVGPVCNRPADPAGCKPAPQELPRFLAVFEQVCQTLAYAHAHGVIHRDLKPANVMVGKFGEVQVMDWGLAKVLDEASRERQRPEDGPTAATGTFFPGSPGLSQAGSVLGTPAYMPPEQARGQIDKLDERADVFGLGAILCEVLTGSPPFARGETSVLIRRSARGELGEALACLDTCGADGELVALAKDCLAAEACDRPRHAGEVAQRVTAYRAGVERRLREAEVERAAALARAEEAKAKIQAERQARRLTLGLTLAAMLLVAAGGGGFAWWWTQRSAMVQDVEMSLADARTHMDQGRLSEARAALERAAGRLGDGGPIELRDRVRKRRVDVAFVGELEEIRLRQATAVKDGNFDDRAASPLYADAFAKYPLDVSAPEKAAADLRLSSVREPLLAALQDWAEITPDHTIREQLERLLERADDNDWRRRFRALAAREDAAGLEALARQEATLEQPAAILTRLGYALQRVGLPDEAVRLLRQAQRRYPADFWVNHDLGSGMTTIGKEKEEAVRFMTVAAALRPDSPGTLYNFGNALKALGRAEEAVAVYRRSIALAPKYGHAHNNLGLALAMQGKVDEAVAEYRLAIALDPTDAAAYSNLGNALKEQGKVDEAVAAGRRAVKLDPKLAKAYYNLGLALYKQDKIEEAITCHRRAIALDPKDAMAHTDLGVALYTQGKEDEAIAEYRQAIALDPNWAHAHINLGIALEKHDKVDQAIAEYRQAIVLDPKTPLAYYNLGIALTRQGKVDDAIAAYRQAIKIDSKFVSAHMNLGAALSHEGKLDEAIACYRQAIALDPNDAEAHCSLGFVLRRRGRLVESLESFRRGHALGSKRPGWPHPSAAWVREAKQLVMQEKKLLDVLAGKVVPASAAERVGHARLCVMTGRSHAAARLLADAFTADPSLADDLRSANRHNAACSAARAGCGESEDAAKLDPSARLRWRRQALTWLRADLAALTRLESDGPPAGRAAVQTALVGWQKDPDLACLRDKEGLAKLPAEERQACEKLWAEVAALLRQSQAKPAAK